MASSTSTFTALLIHACLTPLVLAASNNAVTIQNNAWQGATGGGILGLIVLFIDVMIFCMFVPDPKSSPLSPPSVTFPLSVSECSRNVLG